MKAWQALALVVLVVGFIWLWKQLFENQAANDLRPTFVADLKRWRDMEPHIPPLALPPVKPLKARPSAQVLRMPARDERQGRLRA